MNAEIFEKREYADSVARVDFVRVNSLVVGQHFLMNGIWWEVHSIKNGRLYYINRKARTRKESLGANSQMFVQVVKAS